MKFRHHLLSEVVDILGKMDVKDPGRLTGATTGDIHLYHPRVPTTRIVQHLRAMFTNDLMKNLDVVILNGDVLDRRLSLESEDITIILDWFSRLMRDCKKHDVKLFVLEGTRSHDYKQAGLMEFINGLSRIDCDLHYFTDVTVTELAKGFTGVFVPDEVNYDASETAKEVSTKLDMFGVEKVDMAFIHGMFRYQAPIETPVSHHEEFYESLVNHLIVINHIHNPSSRGRIRAPGSPVRLRHGEEETKGFHVFSITKDTTDDWFVEVENNVVWKTLDVTGLSYTDVSVILRDLDNLEMGANLKMRMTRACPLRSSIRELKRDFPHFSLSEDFVDGKSNNLGEGEDLIVHDGIQLVLTKEVILEKVRERVSTKLDDSKETLILLNEILLEGN